MLSLGRYELFEEIASGGMATVFLGRITSVGGFTRAVAIKRLHPHCAKDPELRATLLDEARLASRIRHPNVVPVLDVIATEVEKGATGTSDDNEICIVSEYVHGASLEGLFQSARAQAKVIAPQVACAIVASMLRGLHAAHEAKDERGQPLDLVHRDVSPQNVLTDVDGVTRVVDFGIAKALGRLQETRDGAVKGKLAYMAPEQLRRRSVTRRTDIYAAGVVLWELLAGRKLFDEEQRQGNEAAIVTGILRGNIPRPSSVSPSEIPSALDAIVARATARDPVSRYATALEMASAIEEESGVAIASAVEVAAAVRALAATTITERALLLEALERTPPGKREEEGDERGRQNKEDEAAPQGLVVDGHPQVASPSGRRRQSRRRRVAFATFGLAGLVTAAIAFVAVVTTSKSSSGRVDDQHDQRPSVSSLNLAVPAPPIPTEGPLSSSSTVTTPSSSPSTRVTRGRPPTLRTPAPRKPSSPPSSEECAPYVDESGHVHYKDGCLR